MTVRLPVLPTCGDCRHAEKIPGLAFRDSGAKKTHRCGYAATSDRRKWKRVDPREAPPKWCPFMREVAP